MRLFASGNHPISAWFHRSLRRRKKRPKREGASKSKKAEQADQIEQIRALSDFLNVGSHRNGYRVVLICPAESMNPGSANALLKSLEEPSAGVVFLLVSHQPSKLPATVRSRCYSLALSLPPRALSLRCLQDQGSKATPVTPAFPGHAPLDAA